MPHIARIIFAVLAQDCFINWEETYGQRTAIVRCSYRLGGELPDEKVVCGELVLLPQHVCAECGGDFCAQHIIRCDFCGVLQCTHCGYYHAKACAYNEASAS